MLPPTLRGRCKRTVCSRELSQDRVCEHMTGTVQTDLLFVQRSGVAVLQFLNILSLSFCFASGACAEGIEPWQTSCPIPLDGFLAAHWGLEGLLVSAHPSYNPSHSLNKAEMCYWWEKALIAGHPPLVPRGTCPTASWSQAVASSDLGWQHQGVLSA